MLGQNLFTPFPHQHTVQGQVYLHAWLDVQSFTADALTIGIIWRAVYFSQTPVLLWYNPISSVPGNSEHTFRTASSG